MASLVVIQVPLSDAVDLDDFAKTLGQDIEAGPVSPFDGETVIQGVIALTAASLPLIRAWLHERVEQRKSQKLVFRGLELDGFSAKEVERIIELIRPEVEE